MVNDVGDFVRLDFKLTLLSQMLVAYLIIHVRFTLHLIFDT